MAAGVSLQVSRLLSLFLLGEPAVLGGTDAAEAHASGVRRALPRPVSNVRRAMNIGE